MKAYEYIAEISKEGYLSVPDSIKEKLRPSGKIRVMLLLDEDEAEWNRFAMMQFAQGYSEQDAMYDSL